MAKVISSYWRLDSRGNHGNQATGSAKREQITSNTPLPRNKPQDELHSDNYRTPPTSPSAKRQSIFGLRSKSDIGVPTASAASSGQKRSVNEPASRKTSLDIKRLVGRTDSSTETIPPATEHTPRKTSLDIKRLVGLAGTSADTAPSGTEHAPRKTSLDTKRLVGRAETTPDREQVGASSSLSRLEPFARQQSNLGSVLEGGRSFFDTKIDLRRLSDPIEALERLKENISPPFDFRHVAHSYREQFDNMDITSQNELIAEYWAVRAAQRPRPDLMGIRAANLYSAAPSSQSQSEPALFHPTHPLEPPPMSSFNPSQNAFAKQVLLTPESTHKEPVTRPIGSFSRPVIRAPPQKTSVTPQGASVWEASAVDRAACTSPQEPSATAVGPANRPAVPARSERRPPPAKSSRSFSLRAPPNSLNIAQAVTTADETARQLQIPQSPGLEDVPEEAESLRKSSRSSIGLQVSESGSQAPESPPMLAPQVKGPEEPTFIPTTPGETRSRPTSLTSQMSDTLGSPRPSFSVNGAQPKKDVSSASRGFDTSWYDDIDYCYDNAAEANCDFQWDTEGKDFECDLVIQSNNSRPTSDISSKRKLQQVLGVRVGSLRRDKRDSAEEQLPRDRPSSQESDPSGNQKSDPNISRKLQQLLGVTIGVPRVEQRASEESISSQDRPSSQDALPDLEAWSARSASSNGNYGALTPRDTFAPSPLVLRPENSLEMIRESEGPSHSPSPYNSRLLHQNSYEAMLAGGWGSQHPLSAEHEMFFQTRASKRTPPPLARPGSEDSFLKSRGLNSAPSSPESKRGTGPRRARGELNREVKRLSQELDSLLQYQNQIQHEEPALKEQRSALTHF